MNSEASSQSCERYHQMLTRLACDDGDPPTELRRHLADCARCQKSLEQTRRLVGALRAALVPGPCPTTLAERIASDLDHVARLSPRTQHRWWYVGMAAALLLAVTFLPWWTVARRGSVSGSEGTALSPADAAVVINALATLAWETPGDYCTSGLSQRIAELSALVRGQTADHGGCLPWTSDEDWDHTPQVPERRGQLPANCPGADGTTAKA